jgi:hypothetical protein
MAEYDIDGWKVPDLKDPDELSYHAMRSTPAAAAPRQIYPAPKAPAPPTTTPAPAQAVTPPPSSTGGGVSQSSVGGFANPFAKNKK